MSTNQTNPKENLAIGAIASFFGSRYGQCNIDRILRIVGITEPPQGNKSEKISTILRAFYYKDKTYFSAFLETLIQHHQLTPKEIEQLRVHTQNLGFDIENKKVVPLASREIILSGHKPYDAFQIIEGILLSAKKRVYIIDPYVDHKIFSLYLNDIDENVEIKLITKNLYGKFKAVAGKFKSQRKNFEVRLLDDIHDRHIIVDDRAWIFGQSIKDAGDKPLSIIELTDPNLVVVVFNKLWSKGKKFL